MGMESPATSLTTTGGKLIHIKWLYCTIASFLGLFFLVLWLLTQSGVIIRARGGGGYSSASSFLDPTLRALQAAAASPFKSQIAVTTTNGNSAIHGHGAPQPPPAVYAVKGTAIGKSASTPLTASFSPPPPQLRPPPTQKCDLYEGRWVYDPLSYPLYHARQCPFLSNQVTCQKNGRPDSDYQNWRWKPAGCGVPRFNGTRMMEMLRGKRVTIVGDSINRNMWESLACLLYNSIQDASSRAVVDIKRGDYKLFRAKDFDCTVEFYWSPFVVELDSNNRILKLDQLPATARRWRTADVLVFNTGHWWTHGGFMRTWDKFQVGGELVEEMEGYKAFEMGMKTWARWVDAKVDHAKTTVFFRSISPTHKMENLQWCYNQTSPITNESYVQWFPKDMVDIVKTTILKMRTQVEFLDITHLSEYRRDAHASVYTTRQGKLLTAEERQQPTKFADCNHWCLPGLPDTWNALIYAHLIRNSEMR